MIEAAELLKQSDFIERFLTGVVSKVEPVATQYMRGIRPSPIGGRPLPVLR
jgi:hypothetical protein